MEERDEYQNFFIELSALLTKYNMMIGEFKLGKPRFEGTKILSFDSDGQMVYPVYFIPDTNQPLI